ncbi:hypothetical protein [Leadbetterella sp. DM7]|uniref:hypothetical protein n=1 Tax=Leadbetterella sp. DM7 TaxID=3235085 RepID=UPI00349EA5A5
MLVNENITAHAWGNGKWVLHTGAERNILLNEKSFELYRILQETETYENALIRFNTMYMWSLNMEDFKTHIATVFGGYGLLKDDFKVERPDMKNQYLKLKIQLINPEWASILAKPVSWLYTPKYFWKAGLLCVLFIACMAFLDPATTSSIEVSGLGSIAVLFYFTMLVHEVGHIAACQNSGVKHGGIGFGFYFIMPVMYADISNIWLANKERRVIANLGGIFNELIYSSILLIIFWFTRDMRLYLVAITIAIFVIFELNPFVRFDGYWVLSDLSNTPNLRLKSKKVLLKTLKEFGKRRGLVRQEVGLFIYGFINSVFLFLFMGAIFINYRIEIIEFPETVYYFIQKALGGNWDEGTLNRKFLLILTFYILLGRKIYGYVKKKSGVLFIGAGKTKTGEIRPLL